VSGWLARVPRTFHRQALYVHERQNQLSPAALRFHQPAYVHFQIEAVLPKPAGKHRASAYTQELNPQSERLSM
jgi:hypothetical protein